MLAFAKSAFGLLGKVSSSSMVRAASLWSKVPLGAPDPILGLNVAFLNDPAEVKVNLGVGAYRTDEGLPWVLPCVRKAEEQLHAECLNHEYPPIDGTAEYKSLASGLLFGEDSQLLKENRVATSQSISGTGALRLASEFLKRFHTPVTGEREVYTSDPTWGNHLPLLNDVGFKTPVYGYYDPSTCGLNEEQFLDSLDKAPAGSLVLLHACAHNPTGVDPTPEQWRKLLDVFKRKKHFAFFDCAYQGFASGDAAQDAYAVRLFAENNMNMLVAQSFSKNLGLYGQRCGLLSIVCQDPAEKEAIESQLRIIVRQHYSMPPVNGARIVSKVLGQPQLKEQWEKEVNVMAQRINQMRHLLVDNLKAAGSQRDWSHITKQIGMFCFTGLTEEQCARLAKDHHVYMTLNGRASVSGINTRNVEYLAHAIHEVTR